MHCRPRAPSQRGERGERAPWGAPAALTWSVAALGAAPPAGIHRLLLPAGLGRAAGTQPARARARRRGPGRGHRRGRAREREGSPRIVLLGPDWRARCSGPFYRGPVSLSAASPCPRCSGNPARAAGRRARHSRSIWPSWGVAGPASPVSRVGSRREGVGRGPESQGAGVDALAGRFTHWFWGLPAPRWVGSDSVIFFFASVSLLLGSLSTLSSALPSLTCLPFLACLSFCVCDTTCLSPLPVSVSPGSLLITPLLFSAFHLHSLRPAVSPWD